MMDPFPGILERKWVDRPFVTKTGKDGCQRGFAFELTPEQKEWLCRWFPEVENGRLMKASGLKFSTFHRMVRELGLKKSEKGLHGIMKRLGAKVKRKLEANGYYDSLRKKKTSKETREGTKRMWQEVREGKRIHPIRIMKKTSPYRYRKMLEKKSANRKELMRRELLRLKYGMEPLSRLHNIRMVKYTPSQLNHRHNALKRGYILMVDCSEQGGERWNIYYDGETRRTPIFEKHLLDDGFKLKEWK